MEKFPKLFKNFESPPPSTPRPLPPTSEGDKELELRLGPPGEDHHSLLIFTNCSTNRSSGAPPVIGWPPVGSFRKNIGGGSSSLSKPAASSKLPYENPEKKSGGKYGKIKDNLYVKINMEGVPIGRKINLCAYENYDQLSFAVHQLFKDLLAAQNDASASGNENKNLEWKLSTSSSANRNDKYTLIYEDNEGDRVLVGDVPWQMFVSTVKKILVLKSSQLSAQLFHTTGEQGNASLDCAVEIQR